MSRWTISKIRSTTLRRTVLLLAIVPVFVLSVLWYTTRTVGEIASELFARSREVWRSADE